MLNNLLVSYSISSIIVCCIVSISFFLIVVLYSLKSRSVLNFVEHVVGSVAGLVGLKPRQNEPEKEESAKTLAKDNSASKNSKATQKAKKPTEPVFSTNLSTPIEDVIKETITEELKSKNLQCSTSRKKGKSKNIVDKHEDKPVSKSTRSKEKGEDNDNIFKVDETVKSLKKKNSNKPKDNISQVNKVAEDNSTIDDIGFSFLPVKDKGKSNKKRSSPEIRESKETVSTAIEHSLRKVKDNTPKSSKINLYKKDIKQIPLAVHTSPKSILEKVQTFTVVTPPEEKLQPEDRITIDLKESKKVCSSVSYASVVTNNTPEVNDISTNSTLHEKVAENEQRNTEVGDNLDTDLDLNIKSNNSIEQEEEHHILDSSNKLQEKRENKLFKPDETDTCNIANSENSEYFAAYDSSLRKEFEQGTKVFDSQSQRKNSENLSKSNSSSIEVISEVQNNLDFQNDHFENFAEDSTLRESSQDQTQFEIIEENLNRLVQSTDSDQYTDKFCESESSSIYVIDNPVEVVESPVRKEEEEPPIDAVFVSFASELKAESHSVPQNSEGIKDCLVYESTVDNFLTEEDEFVERTPSEIEKVHKYSAVEETYQYIGREFIENSQTVNLEDKNSFVEISTKESDSFKNILNSFNPTEEHQQEKEELLVENREELRNQEFETKENSCSLATSNAQNIVEEEFVAENREDLSNSQEIEIKESNCLSEFSNVQNIIEEPTQLEKAEIDIKNTKSFSSDQTNVHQTEIESQHLEETEAIENKESLLNQQITTQVVEINENNFTSVASTVNEDFLHLEKKEETKLENRPNLDENYDFHTVLDHQCVIQKNPDHLQQSSATFIEDERHTTDLTVEGEFLEKVPNQQFSMASSQIRVLTLNNQEHQECTLYRIEKNWIIQFRLGPSLFGRKVHLYCNYPLESKGKLVEFNRDQYQLLNWVLDEGCKNADDTAAYTQIVAKLSGSFHYYFTFEKGDNAERQGSGFFLVDPLLKFGNNEDLPLDCIQCQTVLAKGLGSFSSWEKKLQVAKESGYNMIHFTPIQGLGISNSSYSLSAQLKLNPVFKKENGEMPKVDEVKEFIAKIRKDWKVTSICDIVLNHTANESEWIKIHPEVTYNCLNCPYMRPAYLLDAALHQFSMDVKKGFYEDKGIPIEVDSEDHLNAIRHHFRISVLKPLKIQELFICDGSRLAAEFSNLARVTPPVTRNFNTEHDELKILQDKEFKRLGSTVDMKLALQLYNVYRNDTFDEESRLKRCTEEFKSKLDSLNNSIIQEINDHLTCAVENVIAGLRYFRVQSDGPRVKEITIKNPLVYRYFTDYGTPKSLKEHEEVMYSNNGRFLMAHNGWVMNSDPLKNFAAPDSNVYIRRELIAWGDSVKLRYGDKPEDCPFLWQHMKKYVELTAEIFDGVRLDNCHSTPIPVAEYLLDCARRVRPDLYVVAELFTNSDMTDNIFVNRLGITSLIREAMSAWDSHEEGRLVYRYGGSPVGSFYQPRVRPLVPSVAHALFLDLTHDNPSPVEKRSVFDLLPSTALVNMACCASGSNRGYDELVPHHIHVVDETREYTEWADDEKLARGNVKYVTKKSGIIPAKRAINDIHFTLGKEGYNQVYVDQMDPDIVAVTRHCPDTHESYILVAFTAFGHPSQDSANYQRGIRPLRFEGVLDEIVLEATLSHVNTSSGGSKFAKWEKFVQDSKWVNGLSEYQVTLKQHIQANESDIFEKVDSGTVNVTQLNFKNFKPGSVVVVKASLPGTMRDAIKSVRTLIDQFSLRKETELSLIFEKLTLADLNRLIYRCDQEERDEGFGFDTYNIPNFGTLVYAGLQGFISLLANIRPNNDLGHPMCANLRDGNWMIEYIWKRLKLDLGTRQLGQWIEENTKCFNNIPRYLVPSYFDVVVTGLYVLSLEHCYKLMSIFVNHGSTFVRGLSLGSVQFAAYIKSADLPVLSPNLAPPKPPTRKNDKGETVQACVTLSAGLPHFAVGYMRNWGRDTFIALRGLFILTGRFEEARQHILGYGACLRHGLIPNLLDGGRNSRFNCRDAVWWWLYCIKEYVEEAPNGTNILSDKISRIFPSDDSPAQAPGAVDQPLYDVIQEALAVHFQGLAFRERNAGRQIDEHMTDRGFNNQIGIHPETGFVFGGNEWNCGTWMDKMGSSDKAGNRGKPATPRDGSAVELIGLSKAVITWLWKLSQDNKYPYKGVERTHKNGSITKWTFKEWSNKIQANFEKYFWINDTPVPGEFKPNLINKRGIYKDSYGATQDWADFQLRCNFPIAMVVAPELFTPKQAWKALNQAEKYLLGPLGMKTLDPEDWVYRGDYDNSNDSNDPSVAHGFNYHQGPEWVWPVGFFLRAKLHFAALNGALTETLADTKLVLSKHFTELQTSVWRGLPELTNSNGSYCRDSSRTQAWSMSCILEVLHDLQKIESNQPVHIN